MSSSVPATMRAWTRPTRGPARTHLHLTSFPSPSVPASGSSDVLVRITHVGLDFMSEWIMKTLPGLPFGAPMVPECQFSGVVIAAGSVAPPKLREVGAHVVGFQSPPGILSGQGVLAEYVRIPATHLMKIPDAMEMEHAAALIGPGCTALKMVRTAGVQNGDRVLVNGASGSVGSMAVQLCKERGAEVVGVASGANEELVRGLGADEFVDYRLHYPLPEHLTNKYSARPFDYILDCVGTQALFTESPKYLKATGVVINVGFFEGIWLQIWNWVINALWPTWLGGTPRRYVMFSAQMNKDSAATLVRLVEHGKLRVLIDSVWDMEDARQAYARVATKSAKGKVVIKV